MKLRIWHIPQLPMMPFNVDVENIKEAKKILKVLADYDLFQFKTKVKPDYSNAAGLERYNEKNCRWEEWENDFGDNIDDVDENGKITKKYTFEECRNNLQEDITSNTAI